jgi:hypothetical protein
VMCVATLPAYQRRGYADAAIRFSLGEMSRRTGITRTTLHATEAGRPTYLRMGYHDTAVFTGYMRTAGSEWRRFRDVITWIWVATYVNSFFETRVEQLFTLADVVERAFSSAGIEYRVVGGLATYLYVEEREPDAGRLTKDIDIAVRRIDLEAIAKAVEPFGLEYRHVAGVDMLVQKGQPSVRRAVHMIFSGEKVRKEYDEAVPAIGACRTLRGVRLVPAEDLVRMKLTSYRLKDEMHLKALDEAGVITAEIESGLSPIQRERLRLTRARWFQAGRRTLVKMPGRRGYRRSPPL